MLDNLRRAGNLVFVNEQLTFHPDVAVPLEVVVGCLPGITIVSQKGNRRPRSDWHITHSFFIWWTKTQLKHNSADGSLLRSTLTKRIHTNIFPWWRFTPLSPASNGPAWGLLFICAVGLHHLALLCRNNMLLFAGLLPRGSPSDQVACGRSN